MGMQLLRQDVNLRAQLLHKLHMLRLQGDKTIRQAAESHMHCWVVTMTCLGAVATAVQLSLPKACYTMVSPGGQKQCVGRHKSVCYHRSSSTTCCRSRNTAQHSTPDRAAGWQRVSVPGLMPSLPAPAAGAPAAAGAGSALSAPPTALLVGSAGYPSRHRCRRQPLSPKISQGPKQHTYE